MPGRPRGTRTAGGDPPLRAGGRLPWLSDAIAGVVVGVLAVALTVSLAVLVYANGFDALLGEAIGLTLFGTLAIGIVVMLFSSLPGMYAQVQDAPAAVLAVAAASLVAGFPAGTEPREVFLTVVAANALATVFCGLVLLALGSFRLGRLVRYLPYPVVGGFLAGTGWLLLVGGIGVMAGEAFSFGRIGALLAPDVWVRWVPGLGLAVAFLLLTRWFRHPLTWPGLLAASVIGFFVVMRLVGASAEGWREAGLLLQTFPGGGMLRVLDARELVGISWAAVATQGATMITVAFIATMGVLFNASGLELATGRRMDLNRELSIAGVGNLLGGLGGGMPGYQVLSITMLGRQIGTGSRLTSLVGIGTTLAIVLFGGSLLAWVPMTIVGALLAYLGLSFLQEWIVDARVRLGAVEYGVVLLILLVIAVAGFLQGVGVGLVAALVLFVVSYSRIEVVRHALSGITARSRVTRPLDEVRRLNEVGQRLFVLELQGYVFFGTANKVLERVDGRIADEPPPSFVLLDFRQVTGMDATALLGLQQIAQVTRQSEAVLVLTGLQERFGGRLGGALADGEANAVEFDTIDAGLEWCEERLLEGVEEASHGFVAQLERLLPATGAAPRIAGYFERMEISRGAYLMRSGEPADAMYFIESGQVSARLESHEGGHGEGRAEAAVLPAPSRPRAVRLEIVRGGNLVGELAFFSGGVRTATVVADVPTVAHRLTLEAAERMRRDEPGLAADLREVVLRLVVRRVRHLVSVVDSLQR